MNALIWELTFPNNSEEKEFAVTYLQQIHFIYGLNEIFVPASTLSAIKEFIQPSEAYIKPKPEIAETEKEKINHLESALNSILWDINKTDLLESGVSPFLEVFRIWLEARNLNALIVLPLTSPLSNFSRLIHALLAKKRDPLQLINRDIEFWLFSHFFDLTSEWPYFLSFTESTVDLLRNDLSLIEEQKELEYIRKEYLSTGMTKNGLSNYEQRLRIVLANQKLLVRNLLRKHNGIVTRIEAPLAPSLRNLKIGITAQYWECKSFGKVIEEIGRDTQNLIPYFMNIDFYPLVLLKSVEQILSTNGNIQKLKHKHLFETGCKAELNLALDNYRRRIN